MLSDEVQGSGRPPWWCREEDYPEALTVHIRRGSVEVTLFVKLPFMELQ